MRTVQCRDIMSTTQLQDTTTVNTNKIIFSIDIQSTKPIPIVSPSGVLPKPMKGYISFLTMINLSDDKEKWIVVSKNI